MNLTKLAIENNRVTFVLLAVIVLMGITYYNQLSRDSMPPYTIRVASVVTAFPGAGPERVEELVTDKIEEVAQEIPEVKDITSESRTGLSVVNVTVRDDYPAEKLQEIWDQLRRKIDGITDFPDGISKPNVKDDDIGVVYGIILGLENDGFEYAELKEYADQIRDELIKLPDAARVYISGVQDEEIFIEFDNAKLANYGLSSTQLKNTIAGINIIFSGGTVSLEDERIILEPTGNFDNLDDLKKTIISVGDNGETVYLGDITNIKRGYKSPKENIVRVNGKEAMALSISLKDGANVIRLGEAVDEKVAILNAELPVGLTLNRIASQDTVVGKSISDFIENMIQSIVIVLVVMLLFLGFRTGMVVASLIPITIVTTIFLMGVGDVGLNQVSLAALIMALGMLVDNAIVVSESIMVKMEQGMKAKQAAIESANELTVPLFIASLTTSAAFLSFFLAESTMGDIVGPLFVVITMALVSSWLISLTIITILAYMFIKVKVKTEDDKKPGFFDKLIVYYEKMLDWTLRRSFLFIAIIVVMFFGSIYMFQFIPFIFSPDSDRNLVTVDLNLPLGTKIEKTSEVTGDIEKYIQDHLMEGDSAKVLNYSSYIAEGPKSYDLGYAPGEANDGYAHILVNTTTNLENNNVIAILDKYCFENYPDADVKVQALGSGGGGGADVEVRVSGNSPEELFRISEKMKEKLTTISGTKNIGDDWGPKIKKFVVDIDQSKAQKAGLSNQDIAVSLQTILNGSTISALREGDNSIPIIMRDEKSEEQTVQTLENLNIYAQNSGKNVPLSQVAKIRTEWQYAKIKRYDLYRTITVEAYAKEGVTASDITNELLPWLDEETKNWKPGYFYKLGGESENSSDNMGAVAAYLPLSAFIILLLLIIQFNSIRKTTIVVSTIPLGIIGVVIGLLAFNSYFGFFGFLGIISLAGIVINNAIVLIDRIQIELDEFNRKPADAIVAAAKQRFRPILLTTFTTTLSLIPLYLGGGPMWEPMAVAIMVGLLFATVITLLFVPVLYRLFYKVKLDD